MVSFDTFPTEIRAEILFTALDVARNSSQADAWDVSNEDLALAKSLALTSKTVRHELIHVLREYVPLRLRSRIEQELGEQKLLPKKRYGACSPREIDDAEPEIWAELKRIGQGRNMMWETSIKMHKLVKLEMTLVYCEGRRSRSRFDVMNRLAKEKPLYPNKLLVALFQQQVDTRATWNGAFLPYLHDPNYSPSKPDSYPHVTSFKADGRRWEPPTGTSYWDRINDVFRRKRLLHVVNAANLPGGDMKYHGLGSLQPYAGEHFSAAPGGMPSTTYMTHDEYLVVEAGLVCNKRFQQLSHMAHWNNIEKIAEKVITEGCKRCGRTYQSHAKPGCDISIGCIGIIHPGTIKMIVHAFSATILVDPDISYSNASHRIVLVDSEEDKPQDKKRPWAMDFQEDNELQHTSDSSGSSDSKDSEDSSISNVPGLSSSSEDSEGSTSSDDVSGNPDSRT